MEQEIYNLISSTTKFIVGLSKLEIFLIAANLFTLFAFTYVIKQWLILRYIFFTSSDWCADKIKEICEDSTQIIIENVNQIYEMKYGKKIEYLVEIRIFTLSLLTFIISCDFPSIALTVPIIFHVTFPSIALTGPIIFRSES